MEDDAPFPPLSLSDAHFRIGTAHEAGADPCQDYALAGRVPGGAGGLPFAVLSDGCSMSGRTDAGARVVALSARRLLIRGGGIGPGFAARTAEAAAAAALALGLDPEDLDATLAAVAAEPGGGATALVAGDGIVAARTRAGLELAVADWAGNMPGYPGYLADPPRLAAFLEQSAAAAAREGRAPFRVVRHLVRDGAAEPAGEMSFGAEEGLFGVLLRWAPGEAEVVAALSDGAAQIPGAGWAEVASELTAFGPARLGRFAARRMARALSLMARDGKRPSDDISVAALAAGAAAP